MAKATKPVSFEIQEKKVSQLIDSLQSNSLNIRLQSADKLGNYGRIKPDIIKEALIKVIKDETDYHVRFYAVLSLKKIQQYERGLKPSDAQEIHETLLNDPSSDIRFQATVDMSRLNRIPFINKSLIAAGFNDPNEFYSLEEPAKGRPHRKPFLDPKKLQQKRSTLLPKLLNQLKQNDIDLSLGAIILFNTMKYWPSPVIQEYVKLSNSPHPHLRLNVLNAPIPDNIFKQALNDEYWLIRKMSAFHLGEREITTQIAKSLKNSINDSIADVSIFAVNACHTIKPDNIEIISIILPDLIQALSSEYWDVQLNTAYIIGTFEYNAKPALPALIKLLRSAGITDKDLPYPNYGSFTSQEDVQIQIVNTIGKMGPAAKEAIPHLKWAVKQKHLNTYAVQALKDIEN